MRKLSQSSYWQYEQARLDFWHQCNSSFEAEKVDPVSAAEFFEVGLIMAAVIIIVVVVVVVVVAFNSGIDDYGYEP